MKVKYRAALVGLGNIAWKLAKDENSGASLSHAAAYDAHHCTEIVGGYSCDAEDIASFSAEYGVEGFDSLTEMLRQLKPDIVSICSPNEYHFEQTQICLQQQVPMIWLEKPPAEKAEQCRLLEQMRIQHNPGGCVLVNYQRRYTQSYQNLKKLLDTEEYGGILVAEIRYSRGFVTNGSHVVDLIFFLFGEKNYQIEWVDKLGGENPSAVIRFSKERFFLIHICGIDAPYHCVDVSVTCEKARLSINHGGMTPKIEEVVEHELFPGYYRLQEKPAERLGVGGFDFAFDKALSDLIDSYQAKRSPYSSLSTASQGMALLEGVQSRMLI